MSPFCGATDTPVLDFWWRLLWVSKPEWVLPHSSLAEVYVLRYTFPDIHPWCDTCQPLCGRHGGWAVSSKYLWGIGGTGNWELSCRRSQCEIRQTLYRLSYPGYPLELIKLTLTLFVSMETGNGGSSGNNAARCHGDRQLECVRFTGSGNSQQSRTSRRLRQLKQGKTRKHFIRMRAARLGTVRALVSVATTRWRSRRSPN